MNAKSTALITAGTVGAAACVGLALLIPTGADAATVSGVGSTSSAAFATTSHVSTTSSTGTGSISVNITSPIQRTKTVPANVTCSTTAHTYRVAATSRVINGHTATVKLSVAGYSGPGTYPAIASVTITGSGTDRTIALPRTIKTTVTSAGGSVGLDTTTKNGRHLAGTASWTC